MAKCRNGRENVHSKDGGGGEKLPVVWAHVESCGRHVLSMTCSHTRRWQIFKVESVWVPSYRVGQSTATSSHPLLGHSLLGLGLEPEPI